MSLFDIIRYPIQDWRDQDALCAVPEKIVREWAIDCLTFVVEDYDPKKLPNDTITIHLQLTIGLFNHCRDSEGNLDSNKLNIYCYYFTRMLKKRIEDA